MAKVAFMGLGLLVGFVTPSWGYAQIAWQTDVAQARQKAMQENRLLLFHFWSEDCAPCLRMEQSVFNQPAVARSIASGFVPIKVNTKQYPHIAQHFGIRRIPTDVILTHEGRVLHRDTSPQDPQQFISVLDRVASNNGAGRANGELARSLPGGHPSVPVSAPPSAAGTPPVGHQTPALTSPPNYAASNGPPIPGTGYDPRAATQGYDPRAAAQGYDSRATAQGAPRPSQSGLATGAGSNWRGPASNQAAAPPYSASPAGNGPGNGTNFAAQASQNRQPPSERRGVAPDANVAADPNAVALDGYCPVTLAENEEWKPGNPNYGAVHRQRTYIFASEAQQQKFLSDPDRYSPVLSGYDPVRFAKTNQMVNGQRKHGVFFHGQIYLFADEAALQEFWKNPRQFAEIVAQATYGPRVR